MKLISRIGYEKIVRNAHLNMQSGLTKKGYLFL